MNRDSFLCAGTLQLHGPGTNVEHTLVSVCDDHALHEFHHEFDPSRSPVIESCVNLVRQAIGETFIAPPGMPRQDKHDLRALHHRLVKWNFAKVREAVSLAHIAGTLSHPSRLHIHDVCAGKGIVALYAAYIRRGLGLETEGTAWELAPERQSSHELIKAQFFTDVPVGFQMATVEQSDLQAPSNTPTHVLAKHACGPLTDAVTAQATTAGAAVTGVMTCCHAKLKGDESFWPAALPYSDRRRLARAADPRKETDPYTRDVIGVVSRRVIDALRARHLKGRVEEALPFGRECQRNQVVLTVA